MAAEREASCIHGKYSGWKWISPPPPGLPHMAVVSSVFNCLEIPQFTTPVRGTLQNAIFTTQGSIALLPYCMISTKFGWLRNATLINPNRGYLLDRYSTIWLTLKSTWLGILTGPLGPPYLGDMKGWKETQDRENFYNLRSMHSGKMQDRWKRAVMLMNKPNFYQIGLNWRGTLELQRKKLEVIFSDTMIKGNL